MQAIVGRILRRRQTSWGSISVASTRRCTKRNVPLLIAMPEKIRPSSLAGRRARRPAPHNSARCKVRDKRRTRSEDEIAARWAEAGFIRLPAALCLVSHSQRDFCRQNSSRGFVSCRID